MKEPANEGSSGGSENRSTPTDPPDHGSSSPQKERWVWLTVFGALVSAVATIGGMFYWFYQERSALNYEVARLEGNAQHMKSEFKLQLTEKVLAHTKVLHNSQTQLATARAETHKAQEAKKKAVEEAEKAKTAKKKAVEAEDQAKDSELQAQENRFRLRLENAQHAFKVRDFQYAIKEASLAAKAEEKVKGGGGPRLGNTKQFRLLQRQLEDLIRKLLKGRPGFLNPLEVAEDNCVGFGYDDSGPGYEMVLLTRERHKKGIGPRDFAFWQDSCLAVDELGRILQCKKEEPSEEMRKVTVGAENASELYVHINGHYITCLATDRGLVAAGTFDGHLVVHNGKDDTTPVVGSRGHVGVVEAVAFVPNKGREAGKNERKVVTAGADGRLCLWSVPPSTGNTTGKRPGEIKPERRKVVRSGFIRCLAVDAEGEIAATAGGDNVIHVWNLPDLTMRTILTGHTEEIGALAFCTRKSTGLRLASQSWDGTVRLWSLDTQDGDERKTKAEEKVKGSLRPLMATLRAYNNTAYLGIAFSPDDKQLLALARPRGAKSRFRICKWQMPWAREGSPSGDPRKRLQDLAENLSRADKGESAREEADPDYLKRLRECRQEAAEGREHLQKGHLEKATECALEAHKLDRLNEWATGLHSDILSWFIKELTSDLEKVLRFDVKKEVLSDLERMLRSNLMKALTPELEKVLRDDIAKVLKSASEKELRSYLEEKLTSGLEKKLKSGLEKVLASELEKMPGGRAELPDALKKWFELNKEWYGELKHERLAKEGDPAIRFDHAYQQFSDVIDGAFSDAVAEHLRFGADWILEIQRSYKERLKTAGADDIGANKERLLLEIGRSIKGKERSLHKLLPPLDRRYGFARAPEHRLEAGTASEWESFAFEGPGVADSGEGNLLQVSYTYREPPPRNYWSGVVLTYSAYNALVPPESSSSKVLERTFHTGRLNVSYLRGCRSKRGAYWCGLELGVLGAHLVGLSVERDSYICSGGLLIGGELALWGTEESDSSKWRHGWSVFTDLEWGDWGEWDNVSYARYWQLDVGVRFYISPNIAFSFYSPYSSFEMNGGGLDGLKWETDDPGLHAAILVQF